MVKSFFRSLGIIGFVKKDFNFKFKDYLLFAYKFISCTLILCFSVEVCFSALVEFVCRVIFFQQPQLVLNTAMLFAQIGAWVILAILLPIYWFRVNTKMINYVATIAFIRNINHQKHTSSDIYCPRCKHIMSINSFKGKQIVYVDDKITYSYDYKDTYDSDGKKHVVRSRIKHVEPIYEEEEYTSYYATCQNHLCEFQDYRPVSKSLHRHKFYEMPYRITDTTTYLLYNSSTNGSGYGKTSAYRMGIPTIVFLIISVIVLFLSYKNSYAYINYSMGSDYLIRKLIGLCIIIGITIFASIFVQVYVHYKNK